MCTNFQNIRRRLREMDDGGSGDRRRGGVDRNQNYFTILNEIVNGGVLTKQYPFLMRLAVASFFLIILLLVSKQLEWAGFLFEIVKPMYVVYVGGIAIVDLFAPVLKRLDGWLGLQEEIYNDPPDEPDQQVSEEDDEQEIEESSDPTATEESFDTGSSPSVSDVMIDEDEDISKAVEELHGTPGFVFPIWEDDDEDNNNWKTQTLSAFDTAKNSGPTTSCPSTDSRNNNGDVRRRTLIPAPFTSKGRSCNLRGNPGVKKDTHATLLRALLESELRKQSNANKQERKSNGE